MVSWQRIEELARQRPKFFIGHDLCDCGSGLARDAVSMLLDPTHALRRQKYSFELSDSKVGHFARQLRVQRAMKSLGDLIFDEVGFSNLSERQSGQRLTCFSAHLVIARTANIQITLFELVGEHEYLAEMIGSHGEALF